MTRLYSNIELTTASATTVNDAITGNFNEDGIPMQNLILGCKEQLPKEGLVIDGSLSLSLLDATVPFQDQKNSLTVLYYSWLPANDKELYKDKFLDILKSHQVIPAGRQRIYEVLRRLKAKSMTELGKKRKQRVFKKLFHLRRETDLLAATVMSVLPLFKIFILNVEQNTPVIHKLYDRMESMDRDFLKLSVTAEFTRGSEKKVAALDLQQPDIWIAAEHIMTGQCAPLLTSMQPNDSKAFKIRLLQVYKTTAVYLRDKLPLQNTLLQTMFLLDPVA